MPHTGFRLPEVLPEWIVRFGSLADSLPAIGGRAAVLVDGADPLAETAK